MQNELAYSIYKATTLSKNWLERNGFRYNASLSSKDDGDVYTMRFPVVSYNIYVTVEAEFLINIETNEVKINCYDRGTRSLYGHWYLTDRNDFEPVVYEINEKIKEKMKRLKIVKNSENIKNNRDRALMPYEC